MVRSQMIVLTVTVIGLANCMPPNVAAQQTYSGSFPAELQYPRSRGIDSNGRAVDVDGRVIDQVGSTVDDYGRRITSIGVSRQNQGNGGYTSGGYYPGTYNGVAYTDSVGYSGGYYSSSRSVGTTVVVGANPISPPRSVIVGGVYPSRTVLNNATRGGVIEYTHNGNGYVYSPGSSYQTVISSGPSIFPAISVIPPSEPPVVIETRRNLASAQPASRAREIKLMFPSGATSELSYMLNGTVYSIKPGYVQIFVEDRIWTIEFLRAGNRSQQMRYQLKAGTYLFAYDETGWDLKQAVTSIPVSQPATNLASPPVVPTAPPVTPTPRTPAPTPSPDL